MTMIEKIRAMSAEEMATWFHEYFACEFCELRFAPCHSMGVTPEKCIEAAMKYLESEVIEDEDDT